MIRILVDGASDYPLSELAKNGIEQVSMTVTFGEKNYVEGINLEKDEFYHLLQTSTLFPKTSQPSPQAFLDIFEEAKSLGDEIICILLSSKLSGTYQSALIAKEMADYDGIYLIDSLSASCPIKILADQARRLVTEGQSAPQIVQAIEHLKSSVRVVAVLDTLEYLRRGGRLNKTAAAIGEMVKIKPIITLNENGEISILGKCLGRGKAMNYMMQYIEKTTIDTHFPIYTVYTYGLENCEKFEEKAAEKKIVPSSRLQIGPTIGTHVGPNAFGIVYVNKKD